MRCIFVLAGSIALTSAGGLSLTGYDHGAGLLKQGQSKVAYDDLAGAAASMAGSGRSGRRQHLWSSPWPGGKWASIKSAVQTLSNTLGKSTPEAGAANSKDSGLIGPLSSLIGQ
jgi:hypothetical protein